MNSQQHAEVLHSEGSCSRLCDCEPPNISARVSNTVTLSMFAATVVSTSLHKQSFLWRPLEDFKVFIPAFITRSSTVFTGGVIQSI